MEFFNNQFVIASVISFIFFSLWYILGLIHKRFDIIDIGWGIGFIWVTAGLFAYTSPDIHFAQSLLSMLVCLWGLRLGARIYLRNRGKEEDFRYVAMRKKWKGALALQAYTRIFLVQAFFLVLVAMPIIAVFRDGDSFHSDIILAVGFFLWLSGFIIELFADFQLDRFLQQRTKPSQVLSDGLWKFSRHPNYFGEVTLWWGIWLISFSSHPVWWSAIGPLTITFLILFVSGIPLLEKKQNKNAAYKSYARKTSIFIPLPPKKVD